MNKVIYLLGNSIEVKEFGKADRNWLWENIVRKVNGKFSLPNIIIRFFEANRGGIIGNV